MALGVPHDRRGAEERRGKSGGVGVLRVWGLTWHGAIFLAISCSSFHPNWSSCAQG